MRRPRRLKGRRGATLILVALLMVPLVCLAAFSIDVGWWQVGANQLQTSADAAALAGARALQLYKGQASVQTTAESYASQTAASNKAFSQTVTVNSADVEPMFWTPSTKVLAASNWTDANAVRVTARSTPGLVFAGVARAVAPTIGRQGVAWIANINNGTCIKPWALPYQSLYDRVRQITGIPGPTDPTYGQINDSPRPDLIQKAIADLGTGNYSRAARIIIFRPPTYDGAGGNPDSSAALGAGGPGVGFNNGMYSAYNFLSPSGNNNASSTTYQQNIFGCSVQMVSVTTTNGATLPGSNDIPCATVNALMGSTQNQCQPNNNWNSPESSDWPSGNNKPRVDQPVTCHYRPSVVDGAGVRQWDAGCYPTAVAAATPGSAPGSMQYVAWGDNVYNGSNATDFRMIGRLEVLCVFRGLYTGGGAPANNVESCPTGAGSPPTNYPQGTIVGVIQGLSAPQIGNGTELGNVVSDQQRLILVR